MAEMEKHMIKMQHKARRLKVILGDFELAIIDENIYQMANSLNDMQREIANTYEGMKMAETLYKMNNEKRETE